MSEKIAMNVAAISRQRKKTALKRFIAASCIIFFLLTVKLKSQDLPLISPYLTNSFFYNPSLAGSSSSSLGSISFIHEKNFSDVSGHPVCDILSVHIPVSNYRFGIGTNFFIDRVNALQTTFCSFSFAYHIPFEHNKRLSLGISGNLSQKRLYYSKVRVMDKNEYDLIINKYVEGKFKVDFSVGVNYQANRLILGGTINNLASSGIFHKKRKHSIV